MHTAGWGRLSNRAIFANFGPLWPWPWIGSIRS